MQPRVLHPSRRPARRRGVALIEALIGFLIFAIGVLGLVGLQASMTKAQVGAKVRADAALLANEVLGLMWADSPANHPNYVGAACDAHPPCVDWQRKLKAVLPKGAGSVAYNAAARDEVVVTITWSIPEEGEHRYEMLSSVTR
jgi:type IV pilus assembly protein PilV